MWGGVCGVGEMGWGGVTSVSGCKWAGSYSKLSVMIFFIETSLCQVVDF